MLENGYGFGQQSYSMHQESWQNGYQGHPSGMPIMPNHFMGSPQPSTHQMMYHGNHATHQDLWHAQSMHQNAWLNGSMRQHCITSPDEYGHFNVRYAINVGPVPSTGFAYPDLIASSEYQSFIMTQQVPPPTMRFEAVRYEHGNWGGDGYYRQSYSDGFSMLGDGCQRMEWQFKGL